MFTAAAHLARGPAWWGETIFWSVRIYGRLESMVMTRTTTAAVPARHAISAMEKCDLTGLGRCVQRHEQRGDRPPGAGQCDPRAARPRDALHSRGSGRLGL